MNNADMPAMPAARERDVEIYDGYPDGLTKREYFAGLAMQGLLSGVHAESIITYDDIADDARRCADALLAELEKERK